MQQEPFLALRIQERYSLKSMTKANENMKLGVLVQI